MEVYSFRPKSEKQPNPNYIPPPSKSNVCDKCKNWMYEQLWIGYEFCPYCGRKLDKLKDSLKMVDEHGIVYESGE